MTDLVTEKDLDKSTVVIAENKVQSRLVFGEKTRVLETYLNGIKLLFREIKNGDDRIAVCTGYFDGNQWQLDSPDQSPFVDWNNAQTSPQPPEDTLDPTPVTIEAD